MVLLNFLTEFLLFIYFGGEVVVGTEYRASHTLSKLYCLLYRVPNEIFSLSYPKVYPYIYLSKALIWGGVLQKKPGDGTYGLMNDKYTFYHLISINIATVLILQLKKNKTKIIYLLCI